MAALEERMWWFRAARANILLCLRKHGPGNPERILDAGCGTGGLLARLASACPGSNVTGIDIDHGAAVLARQKSGCGVAEASVDHLPFADASLSCIVAQDTIYHRLVDEASMVGEAYRCLKTGGVFIVQAPAYEWLRSYHDDRVHGARRYTRRRLETVLNGAGFEIVYGTYWNTLLFPIMVLRRKFLSPAKGASDVFAYPAPLEYLFRAVMAAEYGLLRMGLRLPFGGSVLVAAVRKP